MYLSRATIQGILETASPQIYKDSVSASFTLVCTVEEGAACRFASGDWDDPSLAPLAVPIVDELGWKEIEHSARRQVVVRCSISGAGGSQVLCECDRGDGFQPCECKER